MNIILKQLIIENFKGIKALKVEFDPVRTTIKGCNGAGKTSVYDAFLWLLFGKDSEGRADFGIHPLTASGDADAKLVTNVLAVIHLDGKCIILRKALEENVVKGQLRGYSTSTWIDDVPKKISDYKAFIDEIIPEETFKMLTDTYYLNDKLGWQERRKVLLSLCGDVTKPDGFDELLALMGNRSDDDYRDVLREQKKLKTKERDEISPRIDEIKKAIPAEAQSDAESLKATRASIQTQINKSEIARQEIMTSNAGRQKKLDEIAKLRIDQVQVQHAFESDMSGTQKYADERAELHKKAMEMAEMNATFETKMQGWRLDIAKRKTELSDATKELENVRIMYRSILDVPIIKDCPKCKQSLPPDVQEQMNANRSNDLAKLQEQGTAIKNRVTQQKAELEKLESGVQEFGETVKKFNVEYAQFNGHKAAREAEITRLILTAEKPDYRKSPKWIYLNDKIDATEKEVLESPLSGLAAIDSDIRALREQIERINTALSQTDRTAKDNARIAELEAREKELTGDIFEIDRLLAMIGDYKRRQSELIEEAVNGRFEHVSFKLFDQRLNESIVECCTATYKGVPYRDLSYGQKILCGVDCINTMSAHWSIFVPLFIDNSESITYELKTDTQTIELRAVKSAYTLKVE